MVKKNFEEESFQEFFDSKGFKVEEYEQKPKTARSVFTALTSMALLSVLIGGIITIPGLVWGSAAAQVAVPVAEYWKSLPADLPDVMIGERNKLLDKNGDVFAEIWTEDRISLESLDEVSENAINALINTEDKRFYEHNGIDPIGTARAALSSGGGSGITQQLVKNLQFYDLAGKDKKFEATETSYSRKIKELKLALNYERDHSKDEILLNYFNTVAFGAPNIYSLESASNYFFGKSAKKLSVAEAAALVGSVKNPVLYNLNSDKPEIIKAWKDRQAAVIGRMLAEGSITKKEADKALSEKLELKRKSKSGGNCASSDYQFYCEYVLDSLLDSSRFGETVEERQAILAKGGLVIKTYMDPDSIDMIDNHLSTAFGKKNRLVAPTAVVQPGTGGVLAMGQNRDYGTGEGETTINLPKVDAATGSTYKVVTLAAALEVMDESQLTFGSSCPYNPGPNFDYPGKGFGNSSGCTFQAGVLNYKQATAWSSNTWFVTLATKIGMDKVLDMSEKLGLRTDGLSERALSTVLGSKENSPIKMAAAYATFANKGVYCPPTPVESYEYKDGTSPAIPETYDPAVDACRSVMSPSSASGVLKAMRANTYPGEVPNAFSTMGQVKGYDAVGKSGTNQNLNFAWGQVSGDYAFFTDIYDMDAPNRGVHGAYWNRGSLTNAGQVATLTSQMVGKMVKIDNPVRKKLNYNSKEKALIDVPVDRREFFTIPSFNGMSPEEALASARSLGITAEVSKESRPTPELFKSGVIVDQSLTAGTQLPMGSKKELVLYIGK